MRNGTSAPTRDQASASPPATANEGWALVQTVWPKFATHAEEDAFLNAFKAVRSSKDHCCIAFKNSSGMPITSLRLTGLHAEDLEWKEMSMDFFKKLSGDSKFFESPSQDNTEPNDWIEEGLFKPLWALENPDVWHNAIKYVRNHGNGEVCSIHESSKHRVTLVKTTHPDSADIHWMNVSVNDFDVMWDTGGRVTRREVIRAPKSP